jgi:pseudaminic acid biosynthesis-associated methylase
MNDQLNFWVNEYAGDYISKNSQFDQSKGCDAWRKMLAAASDIGSVLECGSNIGRNIGFLEDVLPTNVEKSIIEVSPQAFDFVTSKYKLASCFHGSIADSSLDTTFDLVFTMGVLIHIHPDELLTNMKKMFDYSHKYVLLGEYFSRVPDTSVYQGQPNKLFKQDFGKLFVQNFSVSLVDYGFLWGYLYDEAGFDDITWWLFKKDCN